MSLSLALDLPNQTTNASLGLITSSQAREARSLLATNPSGLSTGDLDESYYNLGQAVRSALLQPSTFSHDERVRAVVFAKALGSYSLGTHFDKSTLDWAQTVAPFFNQAVVVTIQAVDFISSVDNTAGNSGGTTGAWTAVNPDTDVQLLPVGSGVVAPVVVATQDLESLTYARPPALVDGTYTLVSTYARGSSTDSTVTINGTPYPLPRTGSWSNYVGNTLTTSFVVDSSLTQITQVFAGSHNFYKLTFTKNP